MKESNKKICIILGIGIAISLALVVVSYVNKHWFKEKVRGGKYLVTGTVEAHNFLDDNIIGVEIKIKDSKTNKTLIVYRKVMEVYASRNPRSDNYSIECTDEYIAIRLISDDEMEYIKDKEHYNNKDRLYEGMGERFYYEDLEKISNQ